MEWYENPFAKYPLDSANFIARGLIVLLFLKFYKFFWISFTIEAKLSGFQIDEIFEKILDSDKNDSITPNTFHHPTELTIKKLKIILKCSTQALKVTGALKEGCFSMGTVDILDLEKKISYLQYHKTLKRLLINRTVNNPFNNIELQAISKVLDSFTGFKRNTSPYLLYIVQTQCLYQLGYPLYKWNLDYYLEAVYESMVLIFHCDKSQVPSREAYNFLDKMLDNIGLVNDDLILMVFSDRKEDKLFTLNDLVELITQKGE
jgi:hypothetical protein